MTEKTLGRIEKSMAFFHDVWKARELSKEFVELITYYGDRLWDYTDLSDVEYNLMALVDDLNTDRLRAPFTTVADLKPFVDSFGLSNEIRDILIDAIHAEACQWALIDAERRPDPPPPWLQSILEEILEKGVYQFARLQASMPNSTISLELVPLSERLDLGKEQEQECRLLAYMRSKEGL